jgi:hypothetical protein
MARYSREITFIWTRNYAPSSLWVRIQIYSESRLSALVCLRKMEFSFSILPVSSPFIIRLLLLLFLLLPILLRRLLLLFLHLLLLVFLLLILLLLPPLCFLFHLFFSSFSFFLQFLLSPYVSACFTFAFLTSRPLIRLEIFKLILLFTLFSGAENVNLPPVLYALW